MKRSTVRLAAVFAVYVCIFVLAKVLFLCMYAQEGWGASQWLSVIWHGLPMDAAVAGYFTVIPGLLFVLKPWVPRVAGVAMKVYFGIAALVIAAVIVLDAVLYEYWGFRLDSTPLFYFATSPSAALASASAWQAVLGVLGIIVLAIGIYFATVKTAVGETYTTPRMRTSVLCGVLTLLLFFPIRGGVTVSTMNISRAYFSTDRRLNHAAVNPAFSLMYSLTHDNDFGSRYNFMDDAEAQASLAELNSRSPAPADTAATPEQCILAVERPDVYLIILESFSTHLMPSFGGEPVAVQLDSIASTGLCFTDIYASSFRTDRALPAILNAFPAQPSASLMKYVEKAEKLPSLAGVLNENGYRSSYYYGGDANFTNMRALLASAGFDPIVSDADFSVTQKASKWGAADGVLFGRVLADVNNTAANEARPHFTVIQTSSSHEPFNVPFIHPDFAAEPAKNAFAYADSCLGALVRGIEASPRGQRALFVIVPDHYGAWPAGLTDPLARHHIPLVISGPALATAPERIDALGGQPDIAPTLLGLLGIDASDFAWGHNLLECTAPRYAFFSEPGLVALVTETDTAVLDPDANIPAVETASPQTLAEVRAYLQTLYKTIDNL